MSNILSSKDANATMATGQQENTTKPDVKNMDYHRQMLQDKIQKGGNKQYISPSDEIMSPCTAKLNAFRNKQVGKVKPKSLFAQTSAKRLEGEGLFGGRPKGSQDSK